MRKEDLLITTRNRIGRKITSSNNTCHIHRLSLTKCINMPHWAGLTTWENSSLASFIHHRCGGVTFAYLSWHSHTAPPSSINFVWWIAIGLGASILKDWGRRSPPYRQHSKAGLIILQAKKWFNIKQTTFKTLHFLAYSYLNRMTFY